MTVRTRLGREVSESLPELVGLIDAFDGWTAILDGELVARTVGRPDFYALNPNQHPDTQGLFNKLIRPEISRAINAVGG